MSKRTYALLLQTESEYTVKSVIATIVYTTLEEPNSLLTPNTHDWEGGAEYADFRVHAYLGQRSNDAPIWGAGHSYRPNHVQLREAERMVKMLRKVERGLEKLRQEEGWLDSNDYCAYVLRVARILGIKTFYVHAEEGQRSLGMGRWRKLDGAGVQGWLTDLSSTIAKQLNPVP